MVVSDNPKGHHVLTFPGDQFPKTFVLLYCPLSAANEVEELEPQTLICDAPFFHARDLLDHLSSIHSITLHAPETCLPFLDQYLEELKPSLKAGLYLGGTKEDWALRQRLQHNRLCQMLSLQQEERRTTHKLPCTCLFCPEESANKYLLWQHMFINHGFNIGRLDNLVMVDAFLSLLRTKLNNQLSCLWCNKQFPTQGLLRKHMRIKGHYKIRPGDHQYDKFYLVNYVQVGKTWEMFDDGDEELDEEENNFSDQDRNWDDLDESETIIRSTLCLCCDHLEENGPEACLEHMNVKHDFDLKILRKNEFSELLGDFYGMVKFINYLRCCRVQQECAICGEELDEDDSKLIHFKCRGLGNLVEQIVKNRRWDKAQFFKPLFNDDPLLEVIDEEDETIEVGVNDDSAIQ